MLNVWKYAVVLCGLVCGMEASDASRTALIEKYLAFRKEYKKSNDELLLDSQLYEKRLNAFALNSQRIDAHNALFENGQVTFTLGLNHLADLTDDEYKQMLGYHRKTENTRKAGYTYVGNEGDDETADTWDWREHDIVTPVKNQGQCGSCWAFSAVASMESVYAKAEGKLESFSEQELVDCVDGGQDTCTRGGEMSHGFIEIIEHHNGKIDPESTYEYTAQSKGKCKADDSRAIGHFTSYANVTSGDENALKDAVFTQGVISVAIDASSFLFQLYRHGVFSWPFCKKGVNELDHGVAVVGYGTYKGKDFWLVKNSWSEVWGMKGYIMMTRNKNNQCGIATDASYPIMHKSHNFKTIDTVVNMYTSF